ncbi:MAG: YigZ family protein [Chloroflexi bacterium]|nr:YigZ family protein [Chloroflexota bacterium]
MMKGPQTTEKAQGTPLLRYRIPVGEAEGQLEVKNSVFIGTAGHAADVEAAQAFIQRVREAYPDANHHAWAYRLTPGPQALIGSSDDGEPGGTAGRPMLAILEGSGLVEVVVVGTRYFGGIKLGTGGLVRAYSAAAREALQSLPTQELVLHRLARITIDYSLYGTLQYTLPRYGVRIEDEQFTENVTLVLVVPYDRTEQVAALLREWTNGQIALEEMWFEERYQPAAARVE